MNKPIVLIIRDGWGIGSDEKGNAVLAAKTPNIDKLLLKYPNARLGAAGEDVGLPPGSQGSSEVGHLNMGAGRMVEQELVRLNRIIKDGSFFKDPKLLSVIENCKRNKTKLHLMGLVQDQGVHAIDEHLFALLELAKQEKVHEVYIHFFTDGRDTPPRSALIFLNHLEKKIEKLKVGKIGSVIGRYYAMDRDNNWERIKLAYEALTLGKGLYAFSARDAIEAAYNRADLQINKAKKAGEKTGIVEDDEFIKPTVIVDKFKKPLGLIDQGDSVIFFNYRQDRAVQLTKAFVDDIFDDFNREPRLNISFLGFTQYYDSFKYSLIEPMNMSNILGEVLSKNSMCQLRISETQKFRHVTSFFNSKLEKPFAGEDRILIDSPKIPEEEIPEMSAFKITEIVLKIINLGITASKNFVKYAKGVTLYESTNQDYLKETYDLIVINYVNGDMVGHTGSFEAARKAIEVVDECIGNVIKEIVGKGGIALVTADHGNAEQMIDPATGVKQTAHTLNDVEFIYIANDYKHIKLRRRGILSDVAPTILYLMGIKQPDEMTAKSLIK